MCGPKFCSMRISAELKDEAEALRDQGVDLGIEEGLAKKAQEFREAGGEIYLKTKG